MQKEDKTISIIIKTFNSDKTITDTLESVRDFGEIIAIDNHSTDDTIDILKEYRAKIIYSDKFELDSALFQALDEAKGNWILVLEDDEIVPQNLIIELENYILNPKKNKFCVSANKKVFYLKREVKTARIKNELKFFKKGCAEFKGGNLYELKLKEGKTHKIKGFKKNTCILKYLQSDIKHTLTNILDKNQNILKNTTKYSNCVIFKPVFEFIYWYFIRLAIFEGKRGFIFSKEKSIEKFILELMKYEKKMKDSL